MNRQPYETPPTWWPPKMTPWLVRLWRPLINRTLRRSQRITHIGVEGLDHVRTALAAGAGVMITPNHSFHYDSYVMIEAAHRVPSCFHFLSAWQVFAMSRPHERRVLQWHGCFSINREGNDLNAFKTSVDILRESRYPLVIFPEGDIYHHNDRVSPFRDGAMAVAMSAAKKGPRPIVAIPAALKCFYTNDPTSELTALMARLEQALYWRPSPELPLMERIYRAAEGMLALKEIEYLGHPQSGGIAERIGAMIAKVLGDLEEQQGLKDKGGTVPERVKEVRRAIIKASEAPDLSPAEKERLAVQMDDVFFVIQLFSYSVQYVREKPTIERIAETLDKLEEDVLQAVYPAIRGERRAVVRFGEPLVIPQERQSRNAVEEWTSTLENRVQSLLDEINAAHGAAAAPQPPRPSAGLRDVTEIRPEHETVTQALHR